MNRPHETAQLMCPPLSGPTNCASTKMPKPNDEATVIRLGLGSARFTMAQPQHITTKNIIAINSARQAFLNTGVIASPSWMRDLGYPRTITHAGQYTSKKGSLCGLIIFPFASVSSGANSSLDRYFFRKPDIFATAAE